MNYFTKSNGRKIPFDDKFLLPFLSPTSKNTHYRNSPPAGAVSDRQNGRMMLQVHQIIHILREYGVDLEGKRFLDIGTGNGLVPRMLLAITGLDSAVGTDPYLDGEHKTSWQTHSHDSVIAGLIELLGRCDKEKLDINTYKNLLNYENYTMLPQAVGYTVNYEKKYVFEQLSANDLGALDGKFDIVYCKAIEHIPDWDEVLCEISKITAEDSFVYFKHRSFFSYLGPHRYSSINIPWGHLLLNDEEYKEFVIDNYGESANDMIEFYFKGLAMPRYTVSDMVRIASNYDLLPVTIITEPFRGLKKAIKCAKEIDNFWDIVEENHPSLSADEMFSGMYHILFRKV